MRFRLPLFAAALAYLIAWCVLTQLIVTLTGEDEISSAICIQIVSLSAGFLLFPALAKRVREWQQRRAKPARSVLAQDERPPVVYLRAFIEDGTAPETSPLMKVGPLFSPLGLVVDQMQTFEEDLAGQLESVGPFVALSPSQYVLPALGAARLLTRDENWQQTVEELLSRCGLVIFRSGDSESLRWEMNKVVECVPADRVIFYLQIGSEKDKAVQQARYDQFRRIADGILPKPTPARRGRNAFLHFTASWDPLLSRKLGAVLKEKGIPSESYIRYALKNKLPHARLTDGSAAWNWLQKRSTRSRKPSRSLSWMALTWFAAIVALAAGAMYGFVVAVNPVAILNILPMFVLTALVGLSIGLAGRFAGLPGGYAYWLLGLVAGVVFSYAQWAMVFSSGVEVLVLNPVAIVSFAVKLAEIAAPVRGGEIFILANWALGILVAMSVVSLVAPLYGLSAVEYKQVMNRSGDNRAPLDRELASC